MISHRTLLERPLSSFCRWAGVLVVCCCSWGPNWGLSEVACPATSGAVNPQTLAANGVAKNGVNSAVQKEDDTDRGSGQASMAEGTQSIVPKIRLRAWELRPYQVLVWICHDGSPRMLAIEATLQRELIRRSELTDPSGWLVYTQLAPPRWRSRLMKHIQHPEVLTGLAESAELENADKLVVVAIQDDGGRFKIDVREWDVLTQQWGARVERETARSHELDSVVYDGIKKAFMPLARVDRVSEEGEVFMRARAVNSCVRAVQESDGQWVLETIENSPVWVRPDDRFLPVIRRVDKYGNLAKLEPIDFTFLTIDEQDGFQIKCSIQSYHRAPLSGRTSRRLQKLALVIRPPESPTVLTLVSKDDETHVLAGYEIWSRQPGQPKEIPSEFLGMTDWRGKFEIPPNPEGLRLIYVKRGTRFLKKLPIIPGLYPELTTTIPDDETRLYAQGIIAGFQTEILNLVAQRHLYEAEIEVAIKNKNWDEASELLQRYQSLTSPQELKNRMADEETRLKGRTSDKRELDSIASMFSSLREALSRYLSETKEPRLREQLQNARRAESAASE